MRAGPRACKARPNVSVFLREVPLTKQSETAVQEIEGVEAAA